MTERREDSVVPPQVDSQGTPGGVLPQHMEAQFGVGMASGVEGEVLITTKPRAGKSAIFFENGVVLENMI